jgi:hypothetical protein
VHIFKTKTLHAGLALNIIAKCAFGIDTDAIGNPNEGIIKEGKATFAGFVPKSWMETLFMLLPMSYFPGSVKFFPIFPAAWNNLWNNTRDIMKQREEQKITAKDFIAR